MRNGGKHQLTVGTGSRYSKEKNREVGDNCKRNQKKGDEHSMFQAIVGHEQYPKRVKEKSMPIGISDRRRTWHEAVETPCWKCWNMPYKAARAPFAPRNSHLHGPPMFSAIKGPVVTKTISSRCEFHDYINTFCCQSQLEIIRRLKRTSILGKDHK